MPVIGEIPIIFHLSFFIFHRSLVSANEFETLENELWETLVMPVIVRQPIIFHLSFVISHRSLVTWKTTYEKH
jgi:hypothetical protein